MSFLDTFKDGHQAVSFSADNPIYVGAVWKDIISLATTDLTGLSLSCYAVRDEFAEEKLFTCTTSTTLNGSNTDVAIKAAKDVIDTELGLNRVLMILDIIEDSSQDVYRYARGLVSIHGGNG